MRVAILGGTFNPPHLAHLLCASEAADQLELDRVILMPVASPPHKEVPEEPGPEVRLELCELRWPPTCASRYPASNSIVAGRPSRSIPCVSCMHDIRSTS